MIVKKYKYWFMHTFLFKTYFPSIYSVIRDFIALNLSDKIRHKAYTSLILAASDSLHSIFFFYLILLLVFLFLSCSIIFSAAFYLKLIGIVHNSNDFHLLLPQWSQTQTTTKKPYKYIYAISFLRSFRMPNKKCVHDV